MNLPRCALVALFCAAFAAAAAEPGKLDWGAPVVAPNAALTATPKTSWAPRQAASAASPVTPGRLALPAAPTASPRSVSNGLFALDANTVVVIDGKKTSAGEMQRTLRAQLAAKAGPPRTTARLLRGATSTVAVEAVRAPTAGRLPTGATTHLSASRGKVADLLCADHGPPQIADIGGSLTAGSKIKVYGTCFGDRAGRVEIIGPFAGGKLVPPFTAWSMTGIDVQMPADTRGAPDSVVAVSIVSADGKTSQAAQGRYVAARETVEVPDRLWQPGATFEIASTTEVVNTSTHADRVNPAAAGEADKHLRINPQCALESMVTVVLSGDVAQIRGFEQGPPNEANVAIDWTGTCTSTKTTTSYHYVIASVGDDVSITSACRAAFQARAWASCPAGIAP